MTCHYESLGEAWVKLVSLTVQEGDQLSEEGFELRNVVVSFPTADQEDVVIQRFGDPEMVTQMRAVFFSNAANSLGHSYAKLMQGPAGRNDLLDVIELLRAESWSKRAAVSFGVKGNGRVPCINVIQFLIREGTVQASYFARGQDAFRKFYADGLCLAEMVRIVSKGVGVPPGRITGFLASSHVYHKDMPAIQKFMVEGAESLAVLGKMGVD